MTAVRLALRADLRRRWRAMLGLALLLGLVGGVVLTAAAGARRTETAYPRLLAWANASDVAIVPQGTGLNGYFTALAKLPQVQSVAAGQLYQAALPSDWSTSVQVLWSPGGGYGTRVDRARVLSGRMFDEAVPGQAMVNQAMAAAQHLRPGSRVRVLGVPNGPVTGTPDFSKAVTLTFPVTAVVALDPQMTIADGGYGTPTVLVSGSFAAPLPAQFTYGNEAAVRLKPGTPMKKFVDAASALARQYAGTASHPGTGGRVDVIDQADQMSALEQAVRPQAVALEAFAALAGLIVLAVLSQLLSRQLVLESAEFPVLRAFGATRGTLVGLSLARLALVTVAGAFLAVAVAVAASPLMPVGPARAVEPAPGLEVNLAVLGAGAAAVALLPLLVLTPAAWRTAARAAGPLGVAEPGRLRPLSRAAALLSWTGSVPATLGMRLAFEPGRGRTAVPVRSALAGSVIAVAALVAAGVFGASLASLISTPREYGQNWDAVTDLGFGGVAPQAAARFLAATPAVGQYAAGDYGEVTIKGRSIAAIGLDEGRGGYLTLLAGRAPRGAGEIALGARTMRDLGVALGQTVRVTANHENSPTEDKTAAMRVVGTVVLPKFARGTFAPTGLGTGAVVTASVLAEPAVSSGCAGPLCYNFFLLRYRPGADAAAQDAGLTRALRAGGCPIGSCDTTGDQRPAEITSYASVRDVPLVLGAVLAVLAVATLAHVLVTSVRRRRRDLAVLKTLGFTRRQLLRLVAWQATALAAAALAAGLPLGVVGGRLAWAVFASASGVAPQADVPLTLILLAAPVTLLAANVIAAWPGRAAAAVRPATVLHAG